MAEEWLLFQKVDLPHRRFCLPAVSLWPNLCGCCDCKNVNWEISSLASISYFPVFFFLHFEEIPIKCQMILVTTTYMLLIITTMVITRLSSWFRRSTKKMFRYSYTLRELLVAIVFGLENPTFWSKVTSLFLNVPRGGGGWGVHQFKNYS